MFRRFSACLVKKMHINKTDALNVFILFLSKCTWPLRITTCSESHSDLANVHGLLQTKKREKESTFLTLLMQKMEQQRVTVWSPDAEEL